MTTCGAHCVAWLFDSIRRFVLQAEFANIHQNLKDVMFYV